MLRKFKKITALFLVVLTLFSCSAFAFATDVSLPTFKLTVVTNEGGHIVRLKEQYFPGELVTVRAVPYEGFAFYTWQSDDVVFSTVESDTTTFIMPAKDVVIGALFGIKQSEVAQTVTVNFDTMGGSTFSPAHVVVGETLAKPTNVPTKEGYTFEGWYADATCTLPFDFSTPITASTFIYAKWAPVIDEPVQKNSFVDVSEDAWYYKHVMNLAEKNIVSGIGDSKFAPDNNISRAQFATILANLANANLASTETPFSDVPATSWFAKSVAWAYNNGIVNGTSATTFDPNANVTRQDMAVMIVRYVNNVEKKTLAESNAQAAFADDDKISSYASEAVYTMQRTGIISGRPGNIFDPKANAKRSEACKMIDVLMGLIEK